MSLSIKASFLGNCVWKPREISQSDNHVTEAQMMCKLRAELSCTLASLHNEPLALYLDSYIIVIR